MILIGQDQVTDLFQKGTDQLSSKERGSYANRVTRPPPPYGPFPQFVTFHVWMAPLSSSYLMT